MKALVHKNSLPSVGGPAYAKRKGGCVGEEESEIRELFIVLFASQATTNPVSAPLVSLGLRTRWAFSLFFAELLPLSRLEISAVDSESCLLGLFAEL